MTAFVAGAPDFWGHFKFVLFAGKMRPEIRSTVVGLDVIQQYESEE
jgi:hypothetical protein